MSRNLYDIEHVHAAIEGCDEKSFRKWSKIYESYLASIPTVQNFRVLIYSDQFSDLFRAPKTRSLSLCGRYVFVDGTDFSIRQPQFFNRKCWSHKINGVGL